MSNQVKPPLSELLDENFNRMLETMASQKAAKFTNNPMITPGDLEGEGMVAAIRAYELFDPNRGVQFRTYAYTFVTRAMDHFCLKNRFRLSASSKDLRGKFAQVHEANSGMMSIDEVDVPHEPVLQIDSDLEDFFFADMDDRQRGLARDRFIHDMPIKQLAQKYHLSTSGVDEALSKVKAILRRRGRRYESCDTEEV